MELPRSQYSTFATNDTFILDGVLQSTADGPNIVFSANVFTIGQPYKFTLQVTDVDGLSGAASVFTVVNIPPLPGICTSKFFIFNKLVTPSIGTTMTTNYTIICSQW